MSVDSSSPSNSSLNSPTSDCLNSTVSIFINNAFSATRVVLLLPLSLLVLYLGHQRWRQHRSFNTTSHSDILTYHMVAMELLWILGLGFFVCGSTTEMEVVSNWLDNISYYGQNFFHLFTCLERYLAVVHPVTYLGLRKERGIRIRNISIGCAWLLSIGWTAMTHVKSPVLSRVVLLCPLLLSFIVISFCSLSVLCVLIRPGPGDGGQNKGRSDQSKERAFFTIMAIMGALWLWFAALLLYISLGASGLLSPSVRCVLKESTFWFSLPSSLVLPLLYLHRTGKLSYCCYNNG